MMGTVPAHEHVIQSEHVPAREAVARVRAARAERRVGERADAAYGAHRRRAEFHPDRSNTELINHIPAVQFAQSGSQLNGRPCIGRVDQLQTRHGQSRPATIRRHALDQLSDRTADR